MVNPAHDPRKAYRAAARAGGIDLWSETGSPCAAISARVPGGLLQRGIGRLGRALRALNDPFDQARVITQCFHIFLDARQSDTIK